jgi:hypothetical protein
MCSKLVDLIVRNAPGLPVIGVILYFSSHWLGGFGFAAGMFAIMVGVWLSSLRSWRFEPGLWMLSTLIVVMCGALALMLTYGTISDLATRARTGELLDEVTATILLWSLVCVSALITRWNWNISRVKHTRPFDAGVWNPTPDT